VSEVSIKPPWTYFTVMKNRKTYETFKTKLMGAHNLLNAIAGIAIADNIGISKEIMYDALSTFAGVKRRQEIRGQKGNITVMDDFAHHPTAVRETIRAVKPFYPNGRLIAVFEPRTNTSMRNVFQGIYPASFMGADIVCVRKPPLLHKIPPEERFSSKKLVEDLKRLGQEAFYFPDTDAIIDFLIQESKPGDLILIMSNGGFDNIHEKVLEKL
jgi:UDP-N-acetylmuramate: L-alanyl-gamma-D-glutamyl-meso-diaminopimelate ligase